MINRIKNKLQVTDMKKYEFTGETKEFFGTTLQQIRAVRDFGSIHSGDIGGWIEKEENLDHDGNAWVYGGGWEKSPCYIQGTRWAINISSPDTVQCGCQNHTWWEWHDRYAEISAEHGGGDVLDEYIQYFNLMCGLYGHEDCRIERGEYNEKTV